MTVYFNTIHFKDVKDRDSNNELIEFRIAGGSDYQTMYEKVVKAVVRYATVMKAGYDKDAYRKDYVKAVSRLLRKSQEVDPKKLKDYEGTVYILPGDMGLIDAETLSDFKENFTKSNTCPPKSAG